MKDPSGTDIEVPILGVGRAKTRGGLRPLGGTLEDPEGQGWCTDTVAIYLFLANNVLQLSLPHMEHFFHMFRMF